MELDVKEVLDNCTIEGNNVKLPDGQLDRKLYVKIKKALEGIGGKWKGGKVSAFVFPSDPSKLLGRVQDGEKINLKKDYQFFATPVDLADYIVALANLEPHLTVLEPSAGQGAIIDAIIRAEAVETVYYYELMPQNLQVLDNKYKQSSTVVFAGKDFLAGDEIGCVDRIIANPPFSKNQDIDHIYEMYKRLDSDGRLVSIVSKHPFISSNKKETQFFNWLSEKNAKVIEIENGAFKDSGTMVGGYIISIDKTS